MADKKPPNPKKPSPTKPYPGIVNVSKRTERIEESVKSHEPRKPPKKRK
jgi:hypothetical protein